MAVGDLYKLAIHYRSGGTTQEAVNLIYYRQRTALVFDTPEEDLIAAFKDRVIPNLIAGTTNLLAVIKMTVAPMPLGAVSHEDFEQFDGEVTGDAMPAQNAPLISFRTALLAKRGRGRIFLPPSGESNNAVGRPTSTFFAFLFTLGGNLLEDMDVTDAFFAGWTLNVWSGADQVGRPVLSTVPRSFWGSQRDRRGIY